MRDIGKYWEEFRDKSDDCREEEEEEEEDKFKRRFNCSYDDCIHYVSVSGTFGV